MKAFNEVQTSEQTRGRKNHNLLSKTHIRLCAEAVQKRTRRGGSIAGCRPKSVRVLLIKDNIRDVSKFIWTIAYNVLTTLIVQN